MQPASISPSTQAHPQRLITVSSSTGRHPSRRGRSVKHPNIRAGAFIRIHPAAPCVLGLEPRSRGDQRCGDMRRLLLASLLSATAASAAPNVPPGYVQASDWLDRTSQPERYGPLNVLDGRDSTAWCVSGDAPASFTFGFKDIVTVDEVRVYTGDGSDRAAFKARARARKLTLTGIKEARSVRVEDKRGLQVVPLKPGLRGARFTLEVSERFPGAKDDAPVCVTDIVFYAGGKALNGTWLAPKLRYNGRLAPLLGTWFGGLKGAPHRFLSFYLDGTYSLTEEPLEGEVSTTVSGAYTLSGEKLSLDVPPHGRVTVRFPRGDSEGTRPPDASLAFDGPVAEAWGEEFRSQR
ncbi:hypothetical protein JKA73_24760 [Myxococcus xanthus]|nr:hypothetical protein JKA73_24760 [Myxococcus xanthus]